MLSSASRGSHRAVVQTSQLRIQGHHVGDLTSAMGRICTPRKLANATNQSFAFPSECPWLTSTPIWLGIVGKEKERILTFKVHCT